MVTGNHPPPSEDVLQKMAPVDEDYGYGKFSLILIGSVMFGATFNLVTRVGVP